MGCRVSWPSCSTGSYLTWSYRSQVLKNKEEGTELFKGQNYRPAAARYNKALTHAAKFVDLSPDQKKEVGPTPNPNPHPTLTLLPTRKPQSAATLLAHTERCFERCAACGVATG